MPNTPANTSLVRYDSPSEVNTNKDARGPGANRVKRLEQKQLTPTEDILNSILPPREWTEDGKLFVQYVSSTPATESDVIALQTNLDNRLQAKQARETGICPIREELYAQCFDELIRQITINCAERGLLLLRVRDEIRMAVASYQTLYESSIAFGMRKALMAEHDKSEMEKKIRDLQKDTRELQLQLAEFKTKCESAEKQGETSRAESQVQHRELVEKMRKENQMLKKELETLLSIPAQDKDNAPGPSGPGAKASEKKDEKKEEKKKDDKKL